MYCVAHVAIKTLFLFVTFIHTYACGSAHIDTHTHTHTHTHTRTHPHTDYNFEIFGKIAQANTRAIETILVHEI